VAFIERRRRAGAATQSLFANPREVNRRCCRPFALL